MEVNEKIKEEVSLQLSKIKEIRNHIHKNPELSFEEYETSAYVKSILRSEGIDFTDGWVKTGIVAKVVGLKPGKIRALRSELDALPIQEDTEKPYKSCKENKMHACGHDVHTACLLGAALVINRMKVELTGTILFVFQPGEELLPGGASLMLAEGIFKEDKPEYIMAQHVYTEMEAGKVGICSGQYMASSDELYITVKGVGGHGALPHNCVDTILMTSHIITALQSIVSRKSNPILPSVLTIGKINSIGGATNIIPDEVKLEGTFRTMDEEWRKEAHIQIKQIIQEVALGFGGRAEVEIRNGYPCLYNNPILSSKVKANLIEMHGENHVEDIPKRMTSEDFSYYSQEIPACFIRLGVRNEKLGIVSGIHTPKFDIDEYALEIGTLNMVKLGLMVY
jgi:amidohydrolase